MFTGLTLRMSETDFFWNTLATAATRLYNAGVDEQLIMETTGHRSLEGVRSYKRTSESFNTGCRA